jgi:diaminohydroxyphosphoribosylaminopyrimidine deaminase/5-amino-6-(5-phosphoribosylamino)uracil reductase
MVERDPFFMERALLVAERGRGRTSPNPMVGAVVVSSEGVVVGQGAHLQAGGPHAEIAALDAAGRSARDATLYCTLEPCCHVGRTGPCVDRILSAGIARVVIAATDPNPSAGGGAHYLRAHGIEVDEGICEDAAVRQTAPFRTWVARKRPFGIAKAAATADGFVGEPGRRVRITGEAADRFFHRQRAEVDAIVVGSGTMLADDPLLTARECYRYRPLIRVIVDWRVRVPAGARVLSTLAAGPVIMVVLEREAAAKPQHIITLERRGIIVDRRETRALADVFGWLAAREVVTVLIEGGPTLHELCAAEGLIDRVQLAISPAPLQGRGGVPLAAFMRDGWRERDLAAGRCLGADRLLEWDVHGTDRSHGAH